MTPAGPDAETVRILTLAIGSEVEELPDVRRKKITTADPAALMIKTGSNVGRILGRQGLATVATSVSNDPSRWERSRKFLQVCWQGTR